MISRNMTVIAILNLFVAVGCSDRSTTTPAEDLAREAKAVRQELERLKAHDVVITPDKVQQLVSQLDATGMKFMEEIEVWGTGDADVDYLTSQTVHVNAAYAEMKTVLGEFGITIDPENPFKLPDDESNPYWKRYLCKAAVVGGTAGCLAGCAALGWTVVPAAACAGVCAGLGSATMGECNMIQCWEGDGSGCGCGSGSGSGSSCS